MKILAVGTKPVDEIPITANAPVLERVLIVLLLIFIVVDIFEQVIPETAPPVPVELKLFIVFDAIAIEVARFAAEPIVIPVIVLRPVIFVIVLLDKLDTPFQ